MENREYYNQLFDIYRNLLTSIEQETFINYYEEDLSLSEIAENRNITKSSVGKTLKGSIDKLLYFENILKDLSKKKKLENLLEEENLEVLKNKLKELLNQE